MSEVWLSDPPTTLAADSKSLSFGFLTQLAEWGLAVLYYCKSQDYGCRSFPSPRSGSYWLFGISCPLHLCMKHAIKISLFYDMSVQNHIRRHHRIEHLLSRMPLQIKKDRRRRFREGETPTLVQKTGRYSPPSRWGAGLIFKHSPFTNTQQSTDVIFSMGSTPSLPLTHAFIPDWIREFCLHPCWNFVIILEEVRP